MVQKKFSISKRLESFRYAFNGLRILIREEPNARIHLFVAAGVVAGGFFFKISAREWIAVILSIGIVFAAEIFNTAIEHLADRISPGKDDMIKKIKDLSAAAVLVSALTALIIGLIVFLPRIIDLF